MRNFLLWLRGTTEIEVPTWFMLIFIAWVILGILVFAERIVGWLT